MHASLPRLSQRRPDPGSPSSLFLSSFAYPSYRGRHHQKCVIVDAAAPGDDDKRRIVAFVGGIDLTDGRWDTPAHELYKTLPLEHSKDFYNGTAPSTSLPYGPRQPWHDIHMYVEGGPAHDLATNFHDRWMNQNTKWRECLYDGIKEGEFGRGDDPVPGSEDDGDGTWNTQLFRSINMDSADFADGAKKDGRLTHRKGRIFDDSIQRAYIHHIRRAKRVSREYIMCLLFPARQKNESKCGLSATSVSFRVLSPPAISSASKMKNVHPAAAPRRASSSTSRISTSSAAASPGRSPKQPSAPT